MEFILTILGHIFTIFSLLKIIPSIKKYLETKTFQVHDSNVFFSELCQGLADDNILAPIARFNNSINSSGVIYKFASA